MRSLTPLSPSILALCFGVLAPVVQAEPQVSIRLNGQQLQPSWETLADDRFAAEFELPEGILQLGDDRADGQPLKPFQRQELNSASRFDYQVTRPGRYRLLIQTGDDANLRLLPVRQESKAVEQACRPWNGEAVQVPVADVFDNGQRLRDAYSGNTATVQNGMIELTPAPESDGLLLIEVADAPSHQPRDWRNATVYFALTDRFANGDPSNDRSYGREPDGAQEIGTFHGGDLKGLTSKLDYLSELGVDALWISAPYEQIHGWVGGGDKGDFRHYAYHGYYALDYTQLDANMGSEADLRELIAGAHARGIRVLFDVVLNHPGYSTLADMQNLGFGTLREGMAQYLPKRWTTWRPEPYENLHSYHNLIDYDHPSWSRWWGKEWVRAGIADYPAPPSVLVDPVKGSLAFLPDFRTESESPVGLPEFLSRKQPTRAVERDGYRVRDYLNEWLTNWVREFGVDGFRADTVMHVEPAAWAQLRQKADEARKAWSAANPDDPMAGEPFWMVGEVFGHGPETSDYQANGFDALINFAFQAEVAGSASDCLRRANNSYGQYAKMLAATPGHNFMSYASSHDTSLFSAQHNGDLMRQHGLASALLLSPGAVQIYYGDESARPFGPTGSDPYQGTRSDMNWDDHAKPEVAALIRHWQRIGQFRARHPAVGAGSHRQLAESPYVFARQHGDDKIIVVQAR
ncbi:alpha-amylase [Stutzerimonas zhaodongensis]|uniref:Alpha-amylase n=1 Tax=Stutzerimonas zhaodongensis TaxID=1176257 RepID=A0A3M2HJG0_9GAMM|nr:alpha-amylase [Stutzerimonas zhaodongensis]MCQ4317405.1 alpha-amylase [Stutzerimonas zhaodongensis]RMH89881.1 alpha-amylase [Stutzerimonas zhaodongensis]